MEQQILDQLIQVQLLQAKATDADKAAGKARPRSALRRSKPSSARTRRSTGS